MSTFLFPIIRNHIIGKFSTPENKIIHSKIQNYDTQNEEIDLDESLSTNKIALEYRDIIDYNESSDAVHGLGFDLRDFENKFRRSEANKKILKKKRNKTDFPEGTLLEIFQYLYKGYSNKEIAQIYGVSNMTIMHLKRKIALIMIDMGFSMDD
jgi:DNA-directed RNA polymerase specialized sigma subunit